MAAQGEPVVEADEQVLAARLDASHGCSHQSGQVRDAAQPRARLRPSGRDTPPDEGCAQHLGGAEDRVAFGHPRIVAAQ